MEAERVYNLACCYCYSTNGDKRKKIEKKHSTKNFEDDEHTPELLSMVKGLQDDR